MPKNKKTQKQYEASFETVKSKFEEYIDVEVVDPTEYGPNTYYNRNKQLKRKGVVTNWTPELIKEYQRCAEDIVYFARKYCWIVHPDYGKIKIRPFPYQGKMWENYQNSRFNITLACRQSGKSVGYAVYLAWLFIFRPDYRIALLANKAATARGILARVKLVIESLPFFLQPGITAWNRTYVEADTQTTILTGSTSKSSIRGESINCLVLDEFAFVDNDLEFMTSTYPVVSSGDTTQIIIVSTANGIANQFCKIYKSAEEGVNQFTPFRVDWWDVPGRDEEWKNLTVSNTSELQFAQEFGNEFVGSSETLISSERLNMLAPKRVLEHAPHDVLIYEHPLPNHNYMICVDIAEGRGIDYHSWNIVDVTSYPFRQVCTFYNKDLSILYLPDLIVNYATRYNDAFLVVESNSIGLQTAMMINEEFEYDNMYFTGYTKAADVGFKMNKKTRSFGVSNLKDLVDSGNLEIVDENTIFELSSFELINGKFQAKKGYHDDLVMSLVSFAYITQTEWFLDEHGSIETLQRRMIEEKKKAEEYDMMPPPIFDDGSDPWNTGGGFYD